MTDHRRALPAVHSVLAAAEASALFATVGRDRLASAVREVLSDAREEQARPETSLDEWLHRVAGQLASDTRPSLRPVINATGVVLHTNLGRAPLAPAAVDAIAAVASGYTNLEFDLATGTRGSRLTHAREQLCRLTGAEDALVVNNCAAGLVLALRTLAGPRRVLVSRGELVEIGGGFRVPAIMAEAGVTLVEVGTTNRTHSQDYLDALADDVGAIVKVHRSNFAMSGFVADVEVAELAPLARAHGVPLIHDFGSGLLVDLSPWGLPGEPTARDAVAAGATTVIMSGDKLLGGPQCGIVLGTRAAIDAMRRHPLARALRVDKLTLAALEATLALSHDPTVAVTHIPVLAMITAPLADVVARADRLVARLHASDIAASIVPHAGTIGGGAFPDASLPSCAIALPGDAARWLTALRAATPAVVGLARDGHCLLDARTIRDAELDGVHAAVCEVGAS